MTNYKNGTEDRMNTKMYLKIGHNSNSTIIAVRFSYCSVIYISTPAFLENF